MRAAAGGLAAGSAFNPTMPPPLAIALAMGTGLQCVPLALMMRLDEAPEPRIQVVDDHWKLIPGGRFEKLRDTRMIGPDAIPSKYELGARRPFASSSTR